MQSNPITPTAREERRAPCGCAHQARHALAVPDRRRFLALLAFGTAAALAGVPLASAFAAEGTDALLLSCIDYRLTDATTRYMDGRNMAGKYDHMALAGASLGAETGKFPAWRTTFWEHLEIAIDLHHIHQVVLLDHRDCGAYKLILGKDFSKDPKKEYEVHAKELRRLKAAIARKYPSLETELLLMALDGSVETVA
ncbi:MAG TPA: carbonic anhydrase [Alphaproteobacteria bacterium]|nr:carbonic anhydrase [Alphaproteobacteria bacterium]